MISIAVCDYDKKTMAIILVAYEMNLYPRKWKRIFLYLKLHVHVVSCILHVQDWCRLLLMQFKAQNKNQYV